MHLGYWSKLWQWSVLLIKLPPERASNYSAMRHSPCTELNSELNHRSVQEMIWDLFTWKGRKMFPFMVIFQEQSTWSGWTEVLWTGCLSGFSWLVQIKYSSPDFQRAFFLYIYIYNCFLVFNRNIFSWDLSPWQLSCIHKGWGRIDALFPEHTAYVMAVFSSPHFFRVFLQVTFTEQKESFGDRQDSKVSLFSLHCPPTQTLTRLQFNIGSRQEDFFLVSSFFLKFTENFRAPNPWNLCRHWGWPVLLS